VVEDERHIARLLKFVLSKAGYEVCVCHSGEHALMEVDAFRPDALVLDFILPGMTGADFLRKVRSAPDFRTCAVVVLSSQWFDPAEATRIGADVTAMCSKPIAPTTLLRKLNELGAQASIPLGDG
jgi:two-component system phosphate regulon response regulator PhoB